MNTEFSILKELEGRLLSQIQCKKKRSMFDEIHWKSNCILIYGERGIGKTYLLLQKRLESKKGFYFSADHHSIESIGLFDFVFWIIKNYKETVFYIDEIHKYTNWIVELKNLLDSFPGVKFIISGSSAISLYKGSIDLGRRMVDYKMFPMSFREYLYFKEGEELKKETFENIIANYKNISLENNSLVNDVLFQEYVKQGYYPFGLNEDFSLFANRLNKLLDQIILDDMLGIFNFTALTANKLTKLFYFLSHMPPTEVSVLSLSKKIGVNNDTLSNLLFVLNEIGVVHVISKYGSVTDTVKKQQKIFLGNPCLYYANGVSDVGVIREVYFISQIKSVGLEIFWVKQGDYVVKYKDKEYRFEIGGESKSFSQIKGHENSFLALDSLYAEERKIPLYVFGLG